MERRWSSSRETFHPDVCLVAIEPVSNFIMLEQYAPDRTAPAWTQALNTALDGWPVTVSQGTSDEVKALQGAVGFFLRSE